MTAKAEKDEFRIFKAQMDKHNGIQQRWSNKKRHEVRKKNEIDFDKYNQLVVEDNDNMSHEYASPYRGRVQNKSVSDDIMPMFCLAYSRYDNGLKSFSTYDNDVEHFNNVTSLRHKIYVRCGISTLSQNESAEMFALIDSLSTRIAESRDLNKDNALVLQRAVTHCVLQNYNDAINDLSAFLLTDSTSVLGYWQRAYSKSRLIRYESSVGKDIRLMYLDALSDFDKALALSPDNPYLHYNKGNLYFIIKDYKEAISYYNHAIHIDNNLAEAYYNRGMAYLLIKEKEKAIRDFSKAGELGLYNAYSHIKTISSKK